MPSGTARRIRDLIAAAAPRLPADRLSLLCRFALWTIRLDDRIDARDVAPEDLERLRHGIAAATDGYAQVGDHLAEELVGILGGLSTLDFGGGASTRVRAALRAAVATGIEHALLGRKVFAGAARPPDARQYLTVAADTVNYRAFAYALIAAHPGHLDEPLLDRLEPALSHAARAIRLANDLRSVDRDRAEHTLNILFLADRDGTPITSAKVRRQIHAWVAEHHEAVQAAADQAPHHLATLAGSLRRCLELSVGLYEIEDLR